ncbi:hypothetical protein DFH11DRAFT_1551203 [Phellopilus nigrolimitatus]|nr:hypothetical protein DFH11DRAFT_1551203 [Phellopilus nigrolimitatus]
MNGRELSEKRDEMACQVVEREREVAGSSSNFPGPTDNNSDFPGAQKRAVERGDAAGSSSDFPGAQTGGWQREDMQPEVTATSLECKKRDTEMRPEVTATSLGHKQAGGREKRVRPEVDRDFPGALQTGGTRFAGAKEAQTA